MGAEMKMHEFIEARKADILQACLGKLRETREGQTDAELLNELPRFMDSFVALLRRDAKLGETETVQQSTVRRLIETDDAVKRALTRKSQGFDITRVIHDYEVFCDKLNDLAAKEHLVFASREHQLMNIFLDEALARGIEAFTAATAADEREDRAQVLGSLAHEIRNAANGASLAFAMIRRGQVGVSGRTADVVQRSLGRIEALVQNSLVEAKLHGKLPVRKESLGLAELLGHVVEGAYPERGIQVRVEVGHDLRADADARLITTAISNLLQNALKFTRDCGYVTLRARETGDTMVIEVEDQCGGLPEGASESLFKPFVQGAPDPRGVGLGLHIVRGAIEAHGGTVTAKDLPGVGCVFTVTLPRPVSQGEAAAA
jgi:signal transduction histidine kinase